MAVEILANNPSTTVAAAATAVAPGTVQTWTVASSAGFPAASNTATPPTQFHIADPLALSEIITVTNVSGTAWTVTRGAEGTTPVAHAGGYTVKHVVTKNSMDQAARVDWINVVTAFGADPTGATDSTAAIQAAMNAVPAGGGTVYIPTGSYRITSPLTFSVSGTWVEGAGWGSQIVWDGSVVTTGAFRMVDTTTRRCNIRKLRISQTNATAAGTAIEASYFVDSVIENVLIDAGGAGVAPLIGISFNTTGTFYNDVLDCRINVSGANSIGIRFDGGANSNTVRNARIIIDAAASTSTGVFVNARSILLEHADVENGGGTGISLGATGHRCTIIDPYLEANNIGIAWASGVNPGPVTGGTVENSVTADFQDNGALTKPLIIGVGSSAGGEHLATRALFGNVWQPEDLGAIAWNFDPATSSNAVNAVAGTIYLLRVVLRYPATITNGLIGVGTAFTAVANQNFLAFVDSTGAIKASSAAGSLDAKINASGLVTQPFSTPFAALPGSYWLAVLINGGATGTLVRGTGQPGTVSNMGAAAANMRYAINGTAATALPASFTPASNVGGIAFWGGVS